METAPGPHPDADPKADPFFGISIGFGGREGGGWGGYGGWGGWGGGGYEGGGWGWGRR